MKKFLNEFKSFAMKGNALDLAIAVVIGAAFGKIVSSLVADIIVPLLGYVLGNTTLVEIQIGKIMIGNFMKAIIDFILIALSIFLMIKLISKFKKKEDEKPTEIPVPPRQEQLLEEIRDLLKAGK